MNSQNTSKSIEFLSFILFQVGEDHSSDAVDTDDQLESELHSPVSEKSNKDAAQKSAEYTETNVDTYFEDGFEDEDTTGKITTVLFDLSLCLLAVHKF